MKIKFINYGTKNLPYRAHDFDAGVDVFLPRDEVVEIPPHDYTIINLRFGVDIPHGYYGYLCGRSSQAVNGLIIHQAPIDPDYTGPIHLVVFNMTNETKELLPTKAIGQLIIVPCMLVTLSCELKTREHHSWNGSTDKE